MSPAESLPVSRRWRSAVRVNLDVVTNRVAPADGRREGVAASDDRVSPCAITITNVAQRQVTDRPAGHDGCGIAHEIEGLHLTHPSRAIRAYTAATNKDFSAPLSLFFRRLLKHKIVRCVRQRPRRGLSRSPMWFGHATSWEHPQPLDHCAAVPRHACPCPPTLMVILVQ